MEFFEKYKNPIIAAVVGALTAIVLSYLVQIPFWITGAIIGAVSVLFTEQAVGLYDKQVENLKAKREESKSKKADES